MFSAPSSLPAHHALTSRLNSESAWLRAETEEILANMYGYWEDHISIEPVRRMQMPRPQPVRRCLRPPACLRLAALEMKMGRPLPAVLTHTHT